MEVKTQKTAKDYWPKFKIQILLYTTVASIVAGLATLSILLISYKPSVSEIDALIISGFITILFFSLGALLISIVVRPFRIVNDALVYTSTERSESKPPNINGSSIINSGLQPLVKLIYSNKSLQSTTPHSQDNAAEIISSISNSSVGVVALSEDCKVIYHSDTAPIKVDSDNQKRLKLEFYTEQTIEDWVDSVKEDSIRADKTWLRIASGAAGESGRTLFDIHVSYRKGSNIPVLVFLFDRTDTYGPEENDLNFIAFAAHELRGPITVIRGYLDTLIEEIGDEITGEQRELFDRLVVSGNRLDGYINNILNSAKFDQRHLRLNLHETTIDDIYSTISDDMTLRARTQHRLLTVDIPLDLPTVAADTSSVSEVLVNLIDNAIKYSYEGGSVHVTAEQKDSSVEIIVSDTGIGMPSNIVGNLFHKFYRSHRSRETVAGTGIGLYISKAIVESHGGTMQVRSVEGEGSTFSFTLPTYSSVKDKLMKNSGSNTTLISNHSGSWIKNHGKIRG